MVQAPFTSLLGTRAILNKYPLLADFDQYSYNVADLFDAWTFPEMCEVMCAVYILDILRFSYKFIKYKSDEQ